MGLGISGIIAMVVITLMILVGGALQRDQSAAYADAVAGNMAVYHNAVSQYAAANPGVTGTVADSVLGLPTWFTRLPGVTNYMNGGQGWTYFTDNGLGVAFLVSRKLNDSPSVGINQSGTLINPLKGATLSGLPSAIPSASVVIAP